LTFEGFKSFFVKKLKTYVFKPISTALVVAMPRSTCTVTGSGNIIATLYVYSQNDNV